MARKKPISGALKASLLKRKRAERRRLQQQAHQHEQPAHEQATTTIVLDVPLSSHHLYSIPANDLRSRFQKEPRALIEQRKLLAQQPVKRIDSGFQLKWDDLVNLNQLSIPERPDWNYSMGKDELEQSETEVFENWLKSIHSEHPDTNLNLFEHNLEVWRQLWRTIESSHIILLITDARYPLFFLHHGLCRYILNKHRLPIIIVLNKADLVPEQHIDSWKSFFSLNFPQFHVVTVSSHQIIRIDHDEEVQRANLPDSTGCAVEENDVIVSALRVKGGRRQFKSEYKAIGREELFSECRLCIQELQNDASFAKDGRSDGRFTLGMVGMPSSGKSSLINAIVGKHVVSTSRTPGHTKHFQTIMLDDVWTLMDCPGIIFPSVCESRQIQIVMGLYPLAQVAEPYSIVQFVAERTSVPLEEIYNLPYNSDESGNSIPFSAFTIAEGVALKKGWRTSKSGGRPNAHRGAISILTDVVDGRIQLLFEPPKGKMNVPQLFD